MIRIVNGLLAILWCSGIMNNPAYAQHKNDAQGTDYGQSQAQITWLTFDELSDSLNINPKKVIINFHTDWCAYCRKMHREVFTDLEIIQKINSEYYAVSFDAESRDTVYFDGQVFTNKEATNRRRGFHEIARLLGSRNGRITVPTTLFLEPDFSVRHRSFEYLSRRKLGAILDQ